MGHVVTEIPPLHRWQRKYPWERWLDGRLHALRRVEDFSTTPLGFATAAHRYAETHGYKAITRKRGDTVYLMFVPAPGQQPEVAE